MNLDDLLDRFRLKDPAWTGAGELKELAGKDACKEKAREIWKESLAELADG